MNLSRSIFKSILVCGLITASAAFSHGQQVEASYGMSLQLVIGSDEGGSKGDIPNELSAVTKQIKSQFGFSNYRLASTFLGRLTNAGSFSYKSASNIFGKESQGQPVFLEWNITEFHTAPSTKGGQGFMSQGFNFGARIPVTTAINGGDGKAAAVTNYESIGLNLRRISITENTPTMIGTLNLPGTNGTIFLIMTVKSVD